MILIYSIEDDLLINDLIAQKLNADGYEIFRAIKRSEESGWEKQNSAKLTRVNVSVDKIEAFPGDTSIKWEHVSTGVKAKMESNERPTVKSQKEPFSEEITNALSNRDKRFFAQITEIIERRIADHQFSVEELSKDLAMSRSSLHKKLKSLSGYVPNEFIRLIRLKKAAQLILSQEYNISEISYLVGFNSHSYFSKCFVSQFKMPPSEFIEKHKEGDVN